MINTKETEDILDFLAELFNAFDEAKSDDGKISTWEIGGMASLIPSMIKVVMGADKLKGEWVAMDQDKLDAMRDRFLTRRNWQPTDDARDRFAVVFKIASSLVLGGIIWHNTTHPPKAVIA